MLFLLVLTVCACFFIFYKWSKVPEHCIDYKLTTIGATSDVSFCNYKIEINYGRTKQDTRTSNEVEIYHYSPDTNVVKIDNNFIKKFEAVYFSDKEKLDKMRGIYILDYKYKSDIPIFLFSAKNNSEYKNGAFSYIDAPKLTRRIKENTISGSGFISFPIEMGHGFMRHGVNIFNSMPAHFALWDITQGNYNLTFSNENVRCDTILIEFHGATQFSNMYPLPNKITMSGIEFTDPIAIQEILKNGLRFHAEFVELKELSATRTFLLSAIISLLISFIANIVYGIFSKKKSKEV